MSKIKNLIQKIPNPILLVFGSIVFLITWPFILVWTGIHSLFSSKLNDSQKVSILQEVVSIFLLVGLLYLIYWITDLVF